MKARLNMPLLIFLPQKLFDYWRLNSTLISAEYYLKNLLISDGEIVMEAALTMLRWQDKFAGVLI